MSTLLFRDDAYVREGTACVVAITEAGGLILDQTLFFATSGGQPGDRGTLHFGDQTALVTTTNYDAEKRPVHILAEGAPRPQIGDTVRMELDWDNRHRVMRAHTLLHLLCACVPFPVTGCSISDAGGRIDFDIPDGEVPDKAALEARMNDLISQDHAISTRWISDEEMAGNQHLIRTMSVKPPMGTGRVRLVSIGNDTVDVQPCGGTHVRSTAEVGPMLMGKIESKGKTNRRIRVNLT